MAAMADAAATASMGTHSGTFHCDEALGIWMLRQLPEWKEAALVRSRDHEVLKDCTIVIDVDGEYDHATKRYDHHQRGFFETFDGEAGVATDAESATGEFKTKLSACGLVYKHYGREVLQAVAEVNGWGSLEGPRLEAVYYKMYKEMIEGLDAIDNGIEVADEKRYSEGTGLSKRVARMNPRWCDPKEGKEGENAKFELASTATGTEFTEQLDMLINSWLAARDFVEAALKVRLEVDASGEVIQFPSGGMPWKDHLYTLEKEMGVETLVKFVLYTDQGGMWRIQAVTQEGTAFTNRLSLPEAWRGLRNAELCAAVGIEGCTFVHNAGFIGGHETLEGAKTMVQKALELA